MRKWRRRVDGTFIYHRTTNELNRHLDPLEVRRRRHRWSIQHVFPNLNKRNGNVVLTFEYKTREKGKRERKASSVTCLSSAQFIGLSNSFTKKTSCRRHRPERLSQTRCTSIDRCLTDEIEANDKDNEEEFHLGFFQKLLVWSQIDEMTAKTIARGARRRDRAREIREKWRMMEAACSAQWFELQLIILSFSLPPIPLPSFAFLHYSSPK